MGTQGTFARVQILLWAGTGLFWSLVGGIVIGRAIVFEPGVFDDFIRVASLSRTRFSRPLPKRACPAGSSGRTRLPQNFYRPAFPLSQRAPVWLAAQIVRVGQSSLKPMRLT
jgi:hypothetical protein